jgi:hypothetical protein
MACAECTQRILEPDRKQLDFGLDDSDDTRIIRAIARYVNRGV